MSHPLNFVEGSGEFGPSYEKCPHGCHLATSCSICRSQFVGKTKTISKAKLRKIEAKLPQIEEKIIETKARPEESEDEDPKELYAETDVYQKIEEAQEGTEAATA